MKHTQKLYNHHYLMAAINSTNHLIYSELLHHFEIPLNQIGAYESKRQILPHYPGVNEV
jgi:hypothetical protein